MMDSKRLWAKSKPWDAQVNPSMYLLGHLQDVYHSAEKVVAATGHAQLSALGLDPEQYLDRFGTCVLLAAAVHDLGKANDHFQGMLCRTKERQDKQQGVRHEWITVLILQELREWLRPAVASDIDWYIVEWAVSGHHPAHNHPSPPRTCPAGAGVEIRVRSEEADFTDCLTWIGTTFRDGLAPPKLPTKSFPLTGAKNVYTTVVDWFKQAQRSWEASIKNTDEAKLLSSVKDCLIAADIAGSALPKEEPNNANRWLRITEAFKDVPELGHLQTVVEKRLNGQSPRAFQQAVANSADTVTFVKAGCGSGKTLAAYMWAAKNHPTRRLYFCYPTTGTATEGFKDYLFEPEGELGDLGAKLFHSRSRIDHEIILGNANDSASPEAEEAIKADALESWSTPIVACTVDTVLGIVQNNKRGMFGWPALAQSAFVFDEIHAYDDRLFGALLRFLRDLPGLPALLMTASLPKPREEALMDVLKEFRGIDLKPIAGPTELEELPRYHKLVVPDCELMTLIQKEVNGGGKVLWVSNTVNRVMASADAAILAGMNPLQVQIYHSRFKYKDRVERHRDVVGAFTPEHKEGVLACTSQVCEMSLDLKGCTLLVTDNATVPALIQRLGRLNRQAKNGDPTRPFVVIQPENNLPYTSAELEAANVWLGKLPDGGISQKMLADAWESSSENPPDLVPSAWLDGGPMTTVSELREASPGITVIMRSDVKKCHKSSDLGKYTLPMPPPPKAFEWHGWPKHKGIPIVEDALIEYHEMRGATWRKN
jgi:CRISPR-associated endonuclease/helicase Cas3